MQPLTDEQFAQELRGLFDEADKYEGMKSSVQWQIADRLARRYPKGMPIPEAVAFIADKSLTTLTSYRTTAWTWRHEERNPNAPFGAHHSLNAQPNRVEIVGQVTNTHDARMAAGLATNLPGGNLAEREQSADSDTDGAFARMADLLDNPPRRDPTAEEIADALKRRPALRADLIKHTPTVVEDMTSTAEYLKTAGELSEDDVQQERERAVARHSRREETADEVVRPLHGTLTRFQIAFRQAQKELDEAIRLMRDVNEQDVNVDDYVAALTGQVRQLALEVRFYEAKHGRHVNFDAVAQNGDSR